MNGLDQEKKNYQLKYKKEKKKSKMRRKEENNKKKKMKKTIRNVMKRNVKIEI